MNLKLNAWTALCAATLTGVFAGSAMGKEADKAVPADDISIAADLIQQDNANRSRIDMKLAAVKSRKDIDLLIAKSDARTAPLLKLSNQARGNFLSSLKFNEKGLTEFDLGALREMSPTDAYLVLSLFGLQGGAGEVSRTHEATDTDAMINSMPKRMAEFLIDYRCQERATCSHEDSKACTSNC